MLLRPANFIAKITVQSLVSSIQKGDTQRAQIIYQGINKQINPLLPAEQKRVNMARFT